LTQRDLAWRGCSYAYISRLEAGTRTPSVRIVKGLARRLGVSVAFLARGEEKHEEGDGRDLALEGEVALRLNDTETAGRLFALAEAQATSAGARARALAGLGQLAFHLGDAREAIARLEEAFELAQAVASPGAVETLGRAYATVGDRPAAIELFGRSLREAEAASDRLEEIRFGVLLANARIDNSDFAEAAGLLARALRLASEQRDPLLRARLSWSQSRLHALKGEPDSAAVYARKALAILELTEHTHHTARAHQLLAFIELDRGEAQEALDLLRRGRELLGDSGSAYEHAKIQLEEARALACLGRREEAAELAMGAAGQLQAGDEVESGRSFALLAQTFAEHGDDARAVELWELAIELMEGTPTRHLTEAYARYAECLERRGKPDEAFAILKRAMAAQVPGTFAPAAPAG
jgi:tetratricopeptide (TPR) repeat protein